MAVFNSTRHLERRLFAAAVLLVILPICAVAASAQSPPSSRFTHPEEIDRAVINFTGVPIGEVGGARVPADRRLRLAACSNPLGVSWFGSARSTLQVVCEGTESWRIFIATRPVLQSERAAPAVSRGDPITVAVRGRGFTVQQTGEALENGALGDWIGVRTQRDATPIRARIERPGFAVIPAE